MDNAFLPVQSEYKKGGGGSKVPSGPTKAEAGAVIDLAGEKEESCEMESSKRPTRGSREGQRRGSNCLAAKERTELSVEYLLNFLEGFTV